MTKITIDSKIGPMARNKSGPISTEMTKYLMNYDSYSKYNGNASKAAKDLDLSTNTVLRHWRFAGFKK